MSTASGQNATKYPCVFWDGAETGIENKDTMFVTSRVDIDHQIAHTTPQTAPYGFKIKNDTKLVSSTDVPINVIATLTLSSSAYAANGLCNGACNAADECVGWNLVLATFECSLLALSTTGALSSNPVQELSTAGLQK